METEAPYEWEGWGSSEIDNPEVAWEKFNVKGKLGVGRNVCIAGAGTETTFSPGAGAWAASEGMHLCVHPANLRLATLQQ